MVGKLHNSLSSYIIFQAGYISTLYSVMYDLTISIKIQILFYNYILLQFVLEHARRKFSTLSICECFVIIITFYHTFYYSILHFTALLYFDVQHPCNHCGISSIV